MKYTILEQLDNIIFQLNEDNNDGQDLSDEELKERLIIILDLFDSLKTEFDNRYKTDKGKKIDYFITNLTTEHGLAKGGNISLSDEIKNNFKDLFEEYLKKFIDKSSQSENSSTENENNLDEKLKKYGDNNILSEKNNDLTDEIIKKLKDINWENKDIESIKNEIDKL